ncbi:hypothetical protein ACJRO7_011492 [Eucalyptus globulus]|uniref:ALOG domain-containing protein n=1 Tax=Eucalyptus globulus TaxID=34317 RepID=A0ABD3LFE8_EUCGL
MDSASGAGASPPDPHGVLVVPTTSTTAETIPGPSSPQEAAAAAAASPPSRYESQKRRDWNTFLQYLQNHKPPLTLARCSGAQVLEFLKYLDQFGKTKVHMNGCPFFGNPTPPGPCACPLKQAWGSLDALIGRLRAAFEENGGRPELNPFAARAVRIYLREVKEGQAKARGIPYEKKKRKRAAVATVAVAKVTAGNAPVAAGSDQVGSSGESSKMTNNNSVDDDHSSAGAGVIL